MDDCKVGRAFRHISGSVMISQVGSSMPEPIPAFLAMHHFQAPELKKKQFWHGLA
jgi:hypothetical protein